MPVTTCQRNGKSGHKWGEEGFCYTGPGSKEKAARQGRAIEAAKEKRDKYYRDLADPELSRLIKLR